MNADRFVEITNGYSRLRIGVVGDYCLDRYLEIDPARAETSIETGLQVHNVVNVRGQPGGAGTILNNLVALGVGEIHVVGFCGEDGEGYELRRALAEKSGVHLDDFITTPLRRTFVYCKPLVLEPNQPPRELNRLDSKNWTPTPEILQADLVERIDRLARQVDALVLLDQVDFPETGVVTRRVCQAVHESARQRPELLTLADSRRGLHEYPPLGFKMNAAELAKLSSATTTDLAGVKTAAETLARRNQRPVFVTLAERGIVGASPGRGALHISAHPLRGQIDVVGAGDAVTANLVAALAAGATMAEALELAMAAASLVIHQLGTTGSASVQQLSQLLDLG